ncbi:hypothetical protein [Hallella multisaccharivorax]|uniref:hypothetical protein n=1 Tax=Hallella multisaccharivorax TaxID=310514 RepID=UPI00360D006F
MRLSYFIYEGGSRPEKIILDELPTIMDMYSLTATPHTRRRRLTVQGYILNSLSAAYKEEVQ